MSENWPTNEDNDMRGLEMCFAPIDWGLNRTLRAHADYHKIEVIRKTAMRVCARHVVI